MSIHLRFYVNTSKWNIKEKLKEQLDELDEKRIDYAIFDDSDLLLPMMSNNGVIVAGSDNITNELSMIIEK